MRKKVFKVTWFHLELLKRMDVSWDGTEFGAPGIDPKRPYGDSDVIGNMLEIAGHDPNCDDWEELKEAAYLPMKKVHQEMETVLQILLRNLSITTGRYEAEEYSTDWKLVEEIPLN